MAPFSFSLPHSPPRGLLPFHVGSPGGRVQTLVLPDTHFSRTTASQGGPRIPAKGMWALRRTVLIRARVRAACPEGRFFAEISSYPFWEEAALIFIIPQSHLGEWGLEGLRRGIWEAFGPGPL